MIKPTGTRDLSSAVRPQGDEGVAGAAGTSPSRALGSVLQELRQTKLTDQSTQRMTELLVRFTIFAEKGLRLRQVSQVSPEHTRAFVFAAIATPAGTQHPGVATMHLRRSALRLYFRTLRQLGLFEGDPTLDLELPPRSSLAMRPLTDDEVALCRSFSLQTLTATRQPAAWALAEATARTSEIPNIRVSDLDLSSRRVWIHGSSKAEARWGLLSAWGATQLARRVGSLKNEPMEDPTVAYEG